MRKLKRWLEGLVLLCSTTHRDEGKVVVLPLLAGGYTVKRLPIFPSPVKMSLTKLANSPWPGITIISGQGEFVFWHPGCGKGKSKLTFFYSVGGGHTHKTSGFKTSGFKTSETSGLQNVRFTKCQVYKTSGLQNVWLQKTSIYILYLRLVEIRRFRCSHVCRQSDGCVLFSILEVFLPYITIIASNKYKWHTLYF